MSVADHFATRTTAKLDDVPQSMIDGHLFGGVIRGFCDIITVDAAQNDTILIARVSSSARLVRPSVMYTTALGSSVELDVGVFNQDGKSDFTDDDDGIASAIDVSSASTVLLPEAITDHGKAVWEFINGVTSDPRKVVEIRATLQGANPSSGTLAWNLMFMGDLGVA